ncbi:hypothetical protein PInf_023406 [Phytophthora infestans]|nr:hypothetical protein PInf_023406 [Phytophthora infestans]
MGPDHPSDEDFASNAASDGDASSNREPHRKKTKRGGNKTKVVPKPRKATREAVDDPDLLTNMTGAGGASGGQASRKSAEETNTAAPTEAITQAKKTGTSNKADIERGAKGKQRQT